MTTARKGLKLKLIGQCQGMTKYPKCQFWGVHSRFQAKRAKYTPERAGVVTKRLVCETSAPRYDNAVGLTSILERREFSSAVET